MAAGDVVLKASNGKSLVRSSNGKRALFNSGGACAECCGGGGGGGDDCSPPGVYPTSYSDDFSGSLDSNWVLDDAGNDTGAIAGGKLEFTDANGGASNMFYRMERTNKRSSLTFSGKITDFGNHGFTQVAIVKQSDKSIWAGLWRKNSGEIQTETQWTGVDDHTLGTSVPGEMSFSISISWDGSQWNVTIVVGVETLIDDSVSIGDNDDPPYTCDDFAIAFGHNLLTSSSGSTKVSRLDDVVVSQT